MLLVSVGLHALALASLLVLRMSGAPEAEEGARIEVIFGTSGTAPRTVGSASTAATPASASMPRPADGSAGVPASAEAALPAAVARPGAPDPGLRVERPDPLMIPAKDAVGNAAPDYPEEARRLREAGTVLLRLHIGTDGAVTRIETLRSSGVPLLDDAARTALGRWHFLPAIRDGRAVASYRDQPVSFVLD